MIQLYSCRFRRHIEFERESGHRVNNDFKIFKVRLSPSTHSGPLLTILYITLLLTSRLVQFCPPPQISYTRIHLTRLQLQTSPWPHSPRHPSSLMARDISLVDWPPSSPNRFSLGRKSSSSGARRSTSPGASSATRYVCFSTIVRLCEYLL